jgi:hypothetical protein
VTTVRGGNVLFENDGKGHFKDISKESGLGYVGHSSGAVFFDYNNDGLLDLYLVNVGKYTTEERGRGGYFVGFGDAFSGQLKPERTERSRLYKNIGHNRFVDVTDEVGMPYGGWSGDASFTTYTLTLPNTLAFPMTATALRSPTPTSTAGDSPASTS